MAVGYVQLKLTQSSCCVSKLVAASKKLKDAKSIIEGVGRGVFPAFAKG